ncbi:MAG: metal-sensitive transcriptional regulator [Actinomycetota bacterium]|nr:metal-sensitive transcriptional regulator [Actinomycetota bacterium]
MSDKDDNKEAVLRRLRRVEGQVRGVIRMVEEDKGCEDILTQVAAARSAMDRVGIHLLTHRMRECLEVRSNQPNQDAIGEIIDIFLRFSSSIGPVAPET